MRRYQAVPVSFTGDRTLIVAMVDPANVLAIDDIAVMTGYEVRPAVASLADVERLLQRLEDPNFGDGAVAPEELEITDDPGATSTPAAPAAMPGMAAMLANCISMMPPGPIDPEARAP